MSLDSSAGACWINSEPRTTRLSFPFASTWVLFILEGSPPPFDGVNDVTRMYGPRRTVLDKLLIDAATGAGAEVREDFTVQEVLMDGEQVTGIRGHVANGVTVTERSKIVIGADGMRSLVARAVQAPTYHAKPPLTCAYFAYWSGVPIESLEVYGSERRGIFAFPTNDDLTCITIEWPIQEFHSVRTDIEGSFFKAIEQAPHLAERVRHGRREERFVGSGDLPNFYRKPYGPGWALVGDAGFHKDPYLAQGITDAFRDAELVVEAIDASFAGRQSLEDALADYERRRNEASEPIYELNYQAAAFEPPPPEMQFLLGALCGNQAETNRYFGTIAGTVPIPEFFSPEHIGRIIAGGSPVTVLSEQMN